MKIAILGYGKMGRTIEQVIHEHYPQHDVVLKIGSQNTQELTKENLSAADVAIEFSRPELAAKHINACFDAHIPVVVGTTAWEAELAQINQRCSAEGQALFTAPNFSIGVNLFMQLNKQLATLMAQHSQYEVHMEEIHHLQKLDAPSGTAIKLADDILPLLPNKTSWALDEADANDLLIKAKRAPEVPGTHILRYESSVDTIEIKHEAHNRMGFAEGAIVAAQWILGKKGHFTMEDLLKG